MYASVLHKPKFRTVGLNKNSSFIGEKGVPPLFIKWNERFSTLDLLNEVE
jgi:hypothetical protein